MVVVNGVIVPKGFPTSWTPDQADKLGFTGAISLAWPSLVAPLILIIAAKDLRKYSYTPFAILWMWSVALVAFGIMFQWGKFNHLVDFVALVHVQIEWFMIPYLLGFNFLNAYLISSLYGFVLYATMLSAGGIRVGYFAVSLGGAYGDFLLPMLFWWGKQRLLALGAFGHLINATVAFLSFVRYVPLDLYFFLNTLGSLIHCLPTVAGILLNQQAQAIKLNGPETPLNESESPLDNAVMENSYPEPHRIIPVPPPRTALRLMGTALVVSLAASLTLNIRENII